jgi:hypothetical protein
MAELELEEVKLMLDKGVDEEELQLALQALMFHQCLYEEWPSAASYKLIVRNLRHVRPIIGAFGFRLEHSELVKMLVVKLQQPGYGVAMNRLRKDETVVLLCLRLLYEEQMRAGASDESGRVLTISSEVYDQIRRTTGEAPPAAARLFEILALLQRRGLVRVGERDTEQVANVTIYPGITYLVPDLFVTALDSWLERREAAGDVGMLAHVAGALQGGETGPASEESGAASEYRAGPDATEGEGDDVPA